MRLLIGWSTVISLSGPIADLVVTTSGHVNGNNSIDDLVKEESLHSKLGRGNYTGYKLDTSCFECISHSFRPKHQLTMTATTPMATLPIIVSCSLI